MISSPDMAETTSLEGEEFIFGRSSDATVHINDTAFSRFHFKIFTENLITKVADLGSSNGTFINGEHVSTENPQGIDSDDLITTNNSNISIKIISITRPRVDVADSTITHKSLIKQPLQALGISSIDSLSEEIIREADLRVEEIIYSANLEAQRFMTQAQAKSDQLIAEKQALADQFIEKQTNDKKLALKKDLEYEKEKRLLEIQVQNDKDRNALNDELEKYRLSIISDHDKKKEELNLEILKINSEINSLGKKFASESEKQQTLLDEKYEAQKNELAQYIELQEEEKKKLFRLIEEQCENKREQLQIELDIFEQKVKLAEEEFAKSEAYLAQETDNLKSILDQQMVDHNNLLSDFSNYQEEEKKKIIKSIENECEKRRVDLQTELANIEKKIAKGKEEFIKQEKKFEFELSEFVSQQEEERSKSYLLIEAQYENKHFELEAELEIVEQKVIAANAESSALYENYNKQRQVQTQTLDSLISKKSTTSKEIATLEEELINQKNVTTTFLSESRISIKLMQGEVEKFSNLKNESDNNFKISKNALIELEKNLSDLRNKVKREEDLIQQKHQQQQSIEEKIKKLISEQTEINSILDPLKNELQEITKKNALATKLNNDLRNDHNREVANLETNFLQMKKDLEAEMLKLKIIEEERLQNLTRHELNQINKIKADSLRIVLDLEDSITKELSIATSKVFATTIGMEKFREIAPDFESSVRASLKNGVLKLLKNDLNPVDPLKNNALTRAQKSWKPLVVGMGISAIVFGGIPMIFRQVQQQNDPTWLQKEADARQAALPIIKKFIVQKKSKLGESFVESIIYTENFYETVTQEKFRSGLMKEGSVYMFKQWNITEEKSIQSYSMILSLLDNLRDKSDKIDPDYEKRDIKKMEDLEKETMKKLEAILGNAVRLEAALKFQNRYYDDYVNNQAAVTPSATSQ